MPLVLTERYAIRKVRKKLEHILRFLTELARADDELKHPKLIPTHKKVERKLLSVFMALLELSPEVRAQFLALCDYGAGKTCSIESYMEPSYTSSKYADVRPDGLVYCRRGTSELSAFIEAKAAGQKIRPDQISDYVDLASQLGVEAIITISNEFARTPDELPYTLPVHKRRKRSVFHFAWADIRTLLERIRRDGSVDGLEKSLLEQCLDYFWSSDSGILTFDKMPQDWPKFVDSARTGVGFSTKTPGITEIIHAWQQERRDLCSKLAHATHLNVELRHFSGVRVSAEDRLKADRARLAEDYELHAVYLFRESKAELAITAELVSRRVVLELSFEPPENKKAKATISWLIDVVSSLGLPDLDIVIHWKGRGQIASYTFSTLKADPESAWSGQKDRPKSISLMTTTQKASDFRSAKKFISSLEGKALELVSAADKSNLV